ncbi:hypothetical protein QUF81_24110 [Peribacillus simplex]|uniref:Uncharacterized protein n=1 Tax=Peribacillus simplex TaxID=1478 RepID=A0AAW7IGT8_9BACI|nr:hypothetical protein [Peribacillus simplex]AMM91840.1 hypothetical protein UP17_04090 [Peribacillus simplex]MDM5296189.1 hypothetical protein [Peribacillus simplex]MDM5455208.1 hypothetical protein [Peribacillus simplex]
MMVYNSAAELCKGFGYPPVHVKLTIEIVDKRLGPVRAEAEIAIKPVESKGFLEVLVEDLESEHIFADENGSIYGSFGIDQSIQIYDEVLTTIPFEELIGKENWKEAVDSFIMEEKLKGQLEKVLNNYQFSDMSGKYKFRKICTITELQFLK